MPDEIDRYPVSPLSGPAGMRDWMRGIGFRLSQLEARRGFIPSEWGAFTDGDTTPSVGASYPRFGPRLFVVTNTGATNVTALDDGYDGLLVILLFTNGNTTLVHSSGLRNRSGGNVTPGANTTRTYVRRSTSWYEVS